MKFLPALLAMVAFASAKDKEISLDACPATVKATVQTYTANFQLEKVELEGKSVPQDYGAKFVAPDGRRFEVIISADGNVLKTEAKKPKKDK